MKRHHLQASPETCHWGFFDAKLKPVLTVASGDEVTIDTISGGPDVLPQGKEFHIPPELKDVHARSERMVPGHILTGPVAVDGAEVGDVLEVEIMEIALRQNWGYNMIRPLAGTLPDDFHEIPPAQYSARSGKDGREAALGPRSAACAVLRRHGHGATAELGRITSLVPRAMGGNLDNKELRPGAKLYLPVFVPGRAVFMRRRSRSARRRRGLRHRDRDRAAGNIHLQAAQGPALHLSPRRNADPLYDDGDGPGPRPMRHQGAARHDRTAGREAEFVARGRLHALQPGRRPARHPDRKRIEGHSLHDRQVDRARGM